MRDQEIDDAARDEISIEIKLTDQRDQEMDATRDDISIEIKLANQRDQEIDDATRDEISIVI